MPSYISVAEAAGLLPGCRRVMVIGCSGGGKTTLSLRLSERFALPYLSIDRDMRWLPGWQARDRGEQRAILTRLVAAERWIMDRSGPTGIDLRVPRADLILWVRVPRRVALVNLALRVARNHGRVRVAMAEGCPEPLPDRAFLGYIWHFERRSAPRFVAQIDRHGPRVPVALIRSRAEAARLLAG
ncbi:ATPase AAA [Primorskyibacter flagellatus]|uniref:ATPase AAA n=1 Tax=Primorskyibacter flagellatus TaxID=1387277 RepID=A0A917A026_9RHOB|nr:AAA family ATPase [Primorskyibacter flagellatus]GGE20526.1 ATPase AAA [Primorskyibacter flagellatus]